MCYISQNITVGAIIIMVKKKIALAKDAVTAGLLEEDIQVRGRLWVTRNEETYLSWGRIRLLENIRLTSSISAAARNMKMSYSHAWKLVKAMNELSGIPLVESRAGGSGGGGAHLTEAGEKVVESFGG